MAAVLRVLSGQRQGEQVSVRQGEVLSIGRSGESDLQLLGLGVSRFHCVVEDHGGELVLADLNSQVAYNAIHESYDIFAMRIDALGLIYLDAGTCDVDLHDNLLWAAPGSLPSERVPAGAEPMLFQQ